MGKYIVHPDYAYHYGRWIIEGEDKDGRLHVSNGPRWLTHIEPKDTESTFALYEGELAVQELDRDQYAQICKTLGIEESRGYFSQDIKSFGGFASGQKEETTPAPDTAAKGPQGGTQPS